MKTVVLDVDSEANAYIIFESTNARGNELTQLDLVKNYIFGNVETDTDNIVEKSWRAMAQNIEGIRADEFLKTFWTSKFGSIPKARLFQNIKRVYSSESEIKDLAKELRTVADYFVALDDINHEIWSEYDFITRFDIWVLTILGSRQIPAPMIAALCMNFPDLSKMLHTLIVLIMRFQVVGRGRTGVLEKNLSDAAKKISSGEITNNETFLNHIDPIMPRDPEFAAAFKNYYERKASRVTYIYFMLELKTNALEKPKSDDEHSNRPMFTEDIIDNIIPKKISHLWNPALEPLHQKWNHHIANYIVIEKSLFTQQLRGLEIMKKISTVYSVSKYILTNTFSLADEKDLDKSLNLRSEQLSELAVKVWPLPKGIK